MIKLQQFYVAKFNSSLLDFRNYNLDYTLQTMRKNNWVVSLADSQALRTIRAVRYERDPSYLQFNTTQLNKLKQRKKILLRKPFTPELQEINTQIDTMLYIPEYVLVVIEKKKHYTSIIKNGLTLNGHSYTRFLCGAGMARVNTVAFIRSDIADEVKLRLQNGWDSTVKITANKFNAYFALASTATYQIDDEDHPELIPRPLIINDCEIKMDKKVDWVEPNTDLDPDLPTSLQNKEHIVTTTKELDFNLFDGGGLIDISAAKKWAKKLQLDYVPSVFIIRNIYIKGCLFTVDFHKFASEVAHSDTVIDLYGKPQTVKDKDIILTKSMFKLWNAYESLEDYQSKCNIYGNHWGVTRVTPRVDDDWVTTNYQFLQVLDLAPRDVTELCSETLSWLQGISGLDRDTAILYLMGNLANIGNPLLAYRNISDDVLKALIINPVMMSDDYIRQKLVSSINKKIKESYLGKLLIQGCFSTMIPDPYALMEWLFANGDTTKVHGLLRQDQHFSQYWNDRSSTSVIACRSPLTWRSEANKLNLVSTPETRKWYKYLYSGIIYNVWGTDCMLHADSDFDGDIVLTTNNPVFLRCKHYDELNNLPITYAKKTVPKKQIKESELWKADLKSFDTKIGQVTNYSTSMYDLINRFKNPQDSYSRKCYLELIERLKLTRKYQGDQIDHAKGIEIEKFPAHWITHQFISPDDPPFLASYKQFLNDICADKKPLFFKYRYYASGNENKLRQNNMEIYSAISSDDISTLSTTSNLIDYNSPMNQVFHYMEDNLKCLPNVYQYSKASVIEALRTNTTPLTDQAKIDFIKQTANLYFEEKRKFKKGINKEFVNIEQYCRHLREAAMPLFSSPEELANYVVEVCYVRNYKQSKSFAWNVFGKLLLSNLLKNTSTPIQIPLRTDCGPIQYLYNNYALYTIPKEDIQ